MCNAVSAAAHLGVGRRTFFRLKSLADFPAPVVPLVGGLPLYRRKDLDAWVARLEPVEEPRPEPAHFVGTHSKRPVLSRKISKAARPSATRTGHKASRPGA